MNIKQIYCQLLVAAAFVLAGPANARLITYDFTVDGDWLLCCDTPFGMDSLPTLTGQLTVDTDLADIRTSTLFVGPLITAFSLVTGSKTWTLADAPIVEDNNAFISGVNLPLMYQFTLYLKSDQASMFIASKNTFSLEDGQGQFNACNDCVTIENNGYPSDYHPLPVPEPETYAMFLAGLIVMGYTLRRKKIV